MEETCSLKVGLSTESDLSVEFYNFSAICDIYNVSVKKNEIICHVNECVERNMINV